jgi:hypothetical protein
MWAAALSGKVVADNMGRLHFADGPAFEWLDDIHGFYWQDVERYPMLNRTIRLSATSKPMRQNVGGPHQ